MNSETQNTNTLFLADVPDESSEDSQAADGEYHVTDEDQRSERRDEREDRQLRMDVDLEDDPLLLSPKKSATQKEGVALKDSKAKAVKRQRSNLEDV